MTGNDIVDIKIAAIESNWKRRGFLEKIFTHQEQQHILQATRPEKMIWRLWSMKESAYKIYTRQYSGRFFAPQKLDCTVLNETYGQVLISGVSYQTQTSSTKNYVYSIASHDKHAPDLLNDCFEIPQHSDLQIFIYEKLIARYAAIERADKHNFTIIKDKINAPYLYCKKEKITVPVSITHHGNYAAFTIN